jgi:hypothetical protein
MFKLGEKKNYKNIFNGIEIYVINSVFDNSITDFPASLQYHRPLEFNRGHHIPPSEYLGCFGRRGCGG